MSQNRKRFMHRMSVGICWEGGEEFKEQLFFDFGHCRPPNMEKKPYEVHLEVTRPERHAIFRCTRRRPPPKKRKNGMQKYRKKPYEVHLEVTRLERHAIFRRSISLDDVDCFEALKSHTYQSHEFITLLFIELRGPFRVVLMRASCQSRFLCDVIERNRTPILSYCHLAAFTVPHKAVSGPSCGPTESGILTKKTYKSAPFSFHYFKVFRSRSDDRFLPKCVFCTTSSIQSHFHNRIVSTLVAARTVLKPSWGRP